MRNTHKSSCSSLRGFTLIEVAIVLVIIGFIIGGVLASMAMLRGAKMQSIVTDELKYAEAAKQFREKYGYLPGDFPNATNYWGAMTTCPPTAGTASQGGTLTCNGSGNSQINFQTYSAAPPINFNEAFLFWQHLANAQIIEGNYTGTAGSAGTSDHVLGKNVPQGKSNDVGFGISYVGLIASGKDAYGDSTNYSDYNYGHVFIVGGYVSNYLPAAQVISAADAQNIDSKYDDGLPASGTIQTWRYTTTYNPTPSAGVPGCSNASRYYVDSTTGAYAGSSCSLIFITGF